MPLSVKGQPRPPGACRKKGSQNKKTIALPVLALARAADMASKVHAVRENGNETPLITCCVLCAIGKRPSIGMTP
jgi:hypothetical protein